jgi:hypothetical protein
VTFNILVRTQLHCCGSNFSVDVRKLFAVVVSVDVRKLFAVFRINTSTVQQTDALIRKIFCYCI